MEQTHKIQILYDFLFSAQRVCSIYVFAQHMLSTIERIVE
jgi:hypothetical protein